MVGENWLRSKRLGGIKVERLNKILEVLCYFFEKIKTRGLGIYEGGTGATTVEKARENLRIGDNLNAFQGNVTFQFYTQHDAVPFIAKTTETVRLPNPDCHIVGIFVQSKDGLVVTYNFTSANNAMQPVITFYGIPVKQQKSNQTCIYTVIYRNDSRAKG